MQFKRCFWMIVSCLMLVACATNHSKLSFEFQNGKSSFESGYYKEAFHQLLPVAVQGKAEAQYAVGYMYYYGYGVSQDTESGVFWIHRAADQNYPPAVKALLIMLERPIEAQSFVPARQASDAHERNQAAVHAMHEQDTFIPIKKPKNINTMSYNEPKEQPAEPPVKIASSLEEKALQNEEQPRKYALQLYGSYHLTEVKDLQLQLKLKNTGHIYQTTHDGKDWYVLTFGNFITAHEASATQKNLPSQLKKLQPWVRDVNTLQVV